MNRFWDKVDKTPGQGPKGTCWTWTASITKSTGYGAFKVDGKKVDAHRFGYILQNGEIPAGLLVCHSCDFRPCVRGEHLYLGNHFKNNKDMTDKGRRFYRPQQNGLFQCYICKGWLIKDEFTKDSRAKDSRAKEGIGWCCHLCNAERHKEYRRKKVMISG